MTKQVYVTGSLYCGFGGFVDMPENKTWADVTEWYVKWDTLHFVVDGVWHESELNSDTTDNVDYKRPIEGSVEVFAADDYDYDLDARLADA